MPDHNNLISFKCYFQFNSLRSLKATLFRLQGLFGLYDNSYLIVYYFFVHVFRKYEFFVDFSGIIKVLLLPVWENEFSFFKLLF